MPAPYRFHPDAVVEAEEAREWYAKRSLQATAGFLDELDQAIASVIESPERWPAHLHGSRRYVLQRYPFAVVYRLIGDVVEIIAIAHGKRRPGYWRNR